MSLMFDFQIHQTAGAARCGRLTTTHGAIRTPAFMPVGTRGTVKGLLPEQVEQTGAEIVLANTYHLMLRPGADVVAEMGGLHRFTGWSGPILTDSGGYQVFSLAKLNRVTDSGVVFQSHLDGDREELTPRRCMEIQNQLGADIVMVLDECSPFPCSHSEAATAVKRTLKWAIACREAHARRAEQALYAIVQGATFPRLRRDCARELVEMDFPGYAIGGLSVGEGHQRMCRVLDEVCPLLPADRPRYLMGVGHPADLLAAVGRGVDLFDCVLPTRNGRNGQAFTFAGKIKLRNEAFRRDADPLEPGCDCVACRQFSRAYIRHLILVKEMLGPILTTIHNLRFFQRLMDRIRRAVTDGTLDALAREIHQVYPTADSPVKTGG